MHRDERRGARRLAVGIKVKIYRIGKNKTSLVNAYLLETKDMTHKGLFLKTSNTFPINTRLKIEVMLPSQRHIITTEGKVAWLAKERNRRYYPGMGIEITKIDKEEAVRLKTFLRDKFRNYRHAIELKRMYLQLKEMAARLYELEESHAHAEHFRQVIDNAIKEIENIAHILDREVWEIKSL